MNKWDVYEIIDDNFNRIERETFGGIDIFYWDFDEDCYHYDDQDFYNKSKEKFFEILKDALDIPKEE